MTRPETTLLVPISADGRILTLEATARERDPSWRTTPGIRGTLAMDFAFAGASPGEYTLVSDQVLAGLNQTPQPPLPPTLPTQLVVLDQGALTSAGYQTLTQIVPTVIRLTKLSPARIYALGRAGVRKLTIMSALAHNHFWLTHPTLLDHLSLIIYPLIVGGRGEPIFSAHHFDPALLTLRLVKSVDHDYVNLQYDLHSHHEVSSA